MGDTPRVMLLALLSTASAISISLVATDAPHSGVTLEQYRTSNPATDVWVARIDLCAAGMRVDATTAPSGTQSARDWGREVGADVAINADFYRTSPLRVYGRAIGEGVPWPDIQTGVDPSYSDEWYWRDYGWLAVGHDRVDFAHTKWTQRNREPTTGWAPGEVAAVPPTGTLALVSGFPQLVHDGAVYTCASATASDCFPDRSDMRDRHPRSAMGISEDQEELILLVADGRTGSASGLYGAELADLMGQLGAWQAFNIDGGGSAQLWVRGEGTVNNASGNNSGSGLRGVANHLGVFAGGSGRPAHCESEPACGTIPPAGGIIDDEDACFGAFGDPAYWRSEDIGHDGHLLWTNAFESALPSNWAWWQIQIDDPGPYTLEVWAESGEPWFNDAGYEVVSAETSTPVRVDLSAGGWVSLGTFDLATGGDQFVRVVDALDYSPSGDRRIPGDALRLTRVGDWCGDGTCAETEDWQTCPEDCEPPEEGTGGGTSGGTGGGSDGTGGGDGPGDSGWSDPAGHVDVPETPPPAEGGCNAGGAAGAGAALLSLLGVLIRRRAGVFSA